MFKKLLLKYWPGLIITIVIFAFHIRLFIPESSIYITPDYGRSDSWHFSIANKFYYAQELKKNRLPIWNPHIGTGFPTLAEGQTAIFFLPNLVFFRTLPFVLAYNLTLVLSFLTAGWGIYMFCRSQGLSKLASTYAGTIFPLGGFFVFHVQHHNLLQTASLMPWLFWATNEFLQKRQAKYLLALSFILSQQIFAGFPQLTFYSSVGLGLYLLVKLFILKEVKPKLIVFIAISLLFGFSLAAIQLTPSLELLRLSTKESNPKAILEGFPYKPKNLLQILNPYIFGKPKDATYPKLTRGDWGLFWENSIYLGIVPLALALSTAILIFKKRIEEKLQASNFLIIVFLSLLLALGANSPLHVIFSVPPFSIFRVPSRFLLLTGFAITMLSAIYIDKFKKKTLFIGIIILISLFDLFYVFFAYNPISDSDQWLEVPQTAKILQAPISRIYSLGFSQIWNEEFLNNGWPDLNYYLFARNSLDQNSNLFFGLDQFSHYESIFTERGGYKYKIINDNIFKQENKYFLPSKAEKILSSSSVSHIISPYELKSKMFNKISQTENYKGVSFKIYSNSNLGNRFFFSEKNYYAPTKEKIDTLISQYLFNPQKQSILEQKPKVEQSLTEDNTIHLLQETPTQIKLETTSLDDAYLVINDSYYPGWIAKIDNQEVEILPANINSRAVFVPKGDHRISLSFRPTSLKVGLAISLISTVFAFIIYLKYRKFVFQKN